MFNKYGVRKTCSNPKCTGKPDPQKVMLAINLSSAQEAAKNLIISNDQDKCRFCGEPISFFAYADRV